MASSTAIIHFDQHDERWAEVECRYTIPPQLRDREPARVVEEMEQAIEARQREIRAEVRRSGKSFIGAKRLQKQSPRERAKSPHVKGRREPTFKAVTTEAQRAAKAMLRAFRGPYREALALWRAGEECVFPAGTYWLARFAHVPCAPLETAYAYCDTS